MAATSHPLVSQVALECSSAAARRSTRRSPRTPRIGLMEPTGNGVGGDLFAIVWDAKTQKLYGLNASGRSPQVADAREAARGAARSSNSHDHSAAPARCRCRCRARRWLVRAARQVRQAADEGAAAAGDRVRAQWISGHRGHRRRLGAQRASCWRSIPDFAETYMPNGRAPAKGEIFRNPLLANTLSAIAEGGRDAFYKGDIAQRIEDYMRANGGYLTAADLAAHHSEWVEPVSTNYRGYDVWELPPNAQGIAALQMLNILEAYDLKSMGFGSAEYLHLFVEAKKLAFEDRARYYADPEFAKIPLQGAALEGLRGEAPRADRSGAGRARISRRPEGARAGRHDLPDRRRRGRQHGLADPEQLPRHRLGHDARRLRLHPAGPRRAVLAQGRPRQRLRAGQAAVPHHHPRVRHQGRQAVAVVRRDGRRHAAAGARADRREPDRLRHEPAGGRRCAARAA